MDDIQEVFFNKINLMDPFFDSLKDNYVGFEDWFNRKSQREEKAFILEKDGIQGFLYLKIEEGPDSEVSPEFTEEKRLKVGTFKINAHGTKLGERFIKLIFDKMFEEKIAKSYVTIFDEHDTLITLLKEYGFNYWGIKNKTNENVLVKNIKLKIGDIKKDYPVINSNGNQKILLSIYPKYHTTMFPDSKLCTERDHIIKDMSPTNCIEKIYLSKMYGLENVNPGDCILIYRTAENGKSAYFNSVATSVCTVADICNIYNFVNYEEFYNYCKKGSIFTDSELQYFWQTKKYKYIIKMLYNRALNKRIINKDLIEKVGLDRTDYWGFRKLTDEQFKKILELGEINH